MTKLKDRIKQFFGSTTSETTVDESKEETRCGKTFPIDLLKGCPDCGNMKFSEGPSGGVCVNLKCSNCGSTFNFMTITGCAERI